MDNNRLKQLYGRGPRGVFARGQTVICRDVRKGTDPEWRLATVVDYDENRNLYEIRFRNAKRNNTYFVSPEQLLELRKDTFLGEPLHEIQGRGIRFFNENVDELRMRGLNKAGLVALRSCDECRTLQRDFLRHCRRHYHPTEDVVWPQQTFSSFSSYKRKRAKDDLPPRRNKRARYEKTFIINEIDDEDDEDEEEAAPSFLNKGFYSPPDDDDDDLGGGGAAAAIPVKDRLILRPRAYLGGRF